MHARLIALGLVLTACQPQPAPGPGPTTGTGSPTVGLPGGTPAGTPAGTTTDSGTTTTGTPFDCALIPNFPNTVNQLNAPRGYHDVAFTEDGWIIGNDQFNSDLVKVDAADFTEVILDNVGQVQGLEWLPDGTLAVASDATGAILKVDVPNATFTVLTPGVYAYGLVMGPDGKLWSANNNIVQRHDLATGASEVVVGSVPAGGARVINFNADYSRLYIGTNFGNGNVYYVELDANFDPVQGPQVLASGVGSGAYHDGLGVDVCGYLYVPDYSTSAMYRISPAVQVQTYYDSNLTEYGHGLEWGNGVGPWSTTSIYIPLPYGQNRVIELDIGVPRVWDGPILNAPQP